MSQFPSSSDPSMPVMPNFGGPVDYSAEPKTWPKTVGIISIVYGSLGVICNSCIGLSPIAMPMLGDMMRQGVVQQAKQNGQSLDAASIALPPMFQLDPLAIFLGVAGFGLSILLIIAGSMLIKRSPAGRKLHLVWVGAVGLLLLLAGVHAFILHGKLSDWYTNNPDSPLRAQFDPTITLVQSVVSIVIRAAYPGFILIWFGFVKRGTADITNAPEAPVA